MRASTIQFRTTRDGVARPLGAESSAVIPGGRSQAQESAALSLSGERFPRKVGVAEALPNGEHAEQPLHRRPCCLRLRAGLTAILTAIEAADGDRRRDCLPPRKRKNGRTHWENGTGRDGAARARPGFGPGDRGSGSCREGDARAWRERQESTVGAERPPLPGPIPAARTAEPQSHGTPLPQRSGTATRQRPR